MSKLRHPTSAKSRKLRIFLSYSSAQEIDAEEIEMALTTSGHDVFFDRTDLPAGKEYHQAIRLAIQTSDLFVFLISPEAVSKGRYTRTELRYARETWLNPDGRVLPVMVAETDFKEIPRYLRAVTIFYPEGNLAGELTAKINDLAAGIKPEDTISGQVDSVTEEVKRIQLQQKLHEIELEWQREKEENGWDKPENRSGFSIFIDPFGKSAYEKAEEAYRTRKERAISGEDEPVFGKYLNG
jgi:hypothetical protein